MPVVALCLGLASPARADRWFGSVAVTCDSFAECGLWPDMPEPPADPALLFLLRTGSANAPLQMIVRVNKPVEGGVPIRLTLGEATFELQPASPSSAPRPRRDRGRDLIDGVDRAAYLLDRPGGLLGRLLHACDLGRDFLGRLAGLVGQRLDLGSDDREAAACFTGTRRLDGGIEREQIGLGAATVWISPTTWPMRCAAAVRPLTISVVLLLCATAWLEMVVASAARRLISPIDATSSSAPDATAWTFAEVWVDEFDATRHLLAGGRSAPA